MEAFLPPAARNPLRDRLFPNGEWILLLALVVEIALFSAIAQNFSTWENAIEVVRFSVELGLLAIALTPVIISGGIDLSVGSMMGLAGVAFGALWRDQQVPLAETVLIVLLIGCAGGVLNAFFISRFNLPPLVVTLGSFSLFRGIAEGITQGTVNYTGFPKGFLVLGQGYLFGILPVQLLVFIPVVLALLDSPPSLRHRPGSLHNWIFSRRCTLRRYSSARTNRVGLPLVRSGCEFSRDHLRRASWAGESGRGNGL